MIDQHQNDIHVIVHLRQMERLINWEISKAFLCVGSLRYGLGVYPIKKMNQAQQLSPVCTADPTRPSETVVL